jgi:hypothetical protein
MIETFTKEQFEACWLDELEENNVYFSKQSHNNGDISAMEAVAHTQQRLEQDAVRPGDTNDGDSGSQEREVKPIHGAGLPDVREKKWS